MRRGRVPGIRIKLIEGDAAAGGLDDARVLAPKLAGMREPAGVRDHVDLGVHAAAVAGRAQILLPHHEPALQALVVRGDPRWALVGVALQGLDATEREHETTRGVD